MHQFSANFGVRPAFDEPLFMLAAEMTVAATTGRICVVPARTFSL